MYQNPELERYTKAAKSLKGMTNVLKTMVPDGFAHQYRYIAPWMLLDVDDGREAAEVWIKKALKALVGSERRST